MKLEKRTDQILNDSIGGKAISKSDAVYLLSLSENSLETAALKNTANIISRKRYQNNALLLGQIGVDMSPCPGNCYFCAYAEAYSDVKTAVLNPEEVILKCDNYDLGGVSGVFLMTMHQFSFDWFLDLCKEVKNTIPPHIDILANVGDVSLTQLRELKAAGVSGAYHVCRLKEGIDSCMRPAKRLKTVEQMLDVGLSWYNMCEPIGPEHTPEELASQIWLGVDLPCKQHGAMQRFPVPGSPLYDKGQITLSRLGQIVSVIVLATIGKEHVKSIAVNEANLAGLFCGANAFFPEAGEPETSCNQNSSRGYSTASWRQDNEISTADCRSMFAAAGFSNLMDTAGHRYRELHISYHPVN